MMTDSNPDAYRTLVLNADDQAGLCVVRSLGKRGVPVTAASDTDRSLGALSKSRQTLSFIDHRRRRRMRLSTS